MEFSLCSLDCALPVEVTLDEDNGRYMIRKSDSSGEFFNTPHELIQWVRSNFSADEFCDPMEFHAMVKKLTDYLVNPNG
ncbi:hypothetical protein RRV45_13385 [Bacillus sp. DTU_2020_1000418_1_SI_GHA_SEK_038]|uniref:hypothetical protein n=1 Tax=Bacillus sp. DTU_2020_1000418_1_SI_GHA_SEK_038 TaxID=3077585 RepID=UPI0028EBA4F0|nr:hypothetical protein [Bacillus sp. DTU_2020_1000418_1_SI_GHA_SEK_038]WNS73910.1 hypothetical protein RRV45_13385 [Bacillus sp. DTU_2020_1000418_1_SI_GHA_SEK_038]